VTVTKAWDRLQVRSKANQYSAEHGPAARAAGEVLTKAEDVVLAASAVSPAAIADMASTALLGADDERLVALAWLHRNAPGAPVTRMLSGLPWQTEYSARRQIAAELAGPASGAAIRSRDPWLQKSTYRG
jgi:hypothetical protein